MPNPTFTGLLAEWLAGASEETRQLNAFHPQLEPVSPLAALAYMAAARERHNSPALAHDDNRLRTIILRRLDGAERVRKLLQGRSSVSRHEVEQALNG